MKKTFTVSIKSLIFIFLLVAVNQVNSKEGALSLMAYPNPFDNRSENLTIARAGLVDFVASESVQFLVYDYTMQQVYQGSASGKLVWNGFDSSGSRLRPGLYFIRVIVTASDGTIASSFIKVLIK